MKLRNLGSNQTVIETSDREVYFSYSTPVVARVDGEGWMQTDEKFSVTTSRHVNNFLGGINAPKVPQSKLEGLLERYS